jgi:hypothetical protein
VTGQAAPADAEVEPAAGEVIDGGHVLGEPQGMAQRQHLDRDADLDAPGAGGHGARHHQRRGQDGAALLEVELAEPHRVEAELLRRPHLGHGLLEGGRLAHAVRALELGEQPELEPAACGARGHVVASRPARAPGSCCGSSRFPWRCTSSHSPSSSRKMWVTRFDHSVASARPASRTRKVSMSVV